jgi:peroxiredoxin
MKTIHLTLIFLTCLVLFNCSRKKTNEFTLTGKISGLDSGKIILNYVPDNKPVLDTVEILNGGFTFHGQIKEPLFSALYMDRNLNRASLFIEPGTMTIYLLKDDFKDFKMNGSKSQDEVFFLNNLLKPYEDKNNSLYSDWSKISDSLKNSTDENKNSDLQNQMDNLRSLMSRIDEIADSIKLRYVTDNPKSYVSAYYLQSMTVGNEKISLDSLKSVFNKMDTTVQKGKYGNRISDDIRKRENTQIGAMAPDFKATDLNNQTITLSQFKNKNIVLLDFWASWCVPCRNNIPNLKKNYNEYHNKGLEVIAISLDNNKKAWAEAVQQDGTNIWYNIHHGLNIFNPGDIKEQDVYANYFYNSIPTQILIDFNGKIIGLWVGSSSDNKESLESILAEKLSVK